MSLGVRVAPGSPAGIVERLLDIDQQQRGGMRNGPKYSNVGLWVRRPPNEHANRHAWVRRSLRGGWRHCVASVRRRIIVAWCSMRPTILARIHHGPR
jgi:hypothetical protein